MEEKNVVHGKYYGRVSQETRKKYEDEKYDSVRFRVKKGQRELIHMTAKKRGMSTAEFITDCLTRCGCPVTSKPAVDEE